MTAMPKNCQILRTNWYNCFKRGFIGYVIYKTWLLGAKGAKKQSNSKIAPKGSKIRKASIYLSNYDSNAKKLANVEK